MNSTPQSVTQFNFLLRTIPRSALDQGRNLEMESAKSDCPVRQSDCRGRNRALVPQASLAQRVKGAERVPRRLDPSPAEASPVRTGELPLPAIARVCDRTPARPVAPARRKGCREVEERALFRRERRGSAALPDIGRTPPRSRLLLHYTLADPRKYARKLLRREWVSPFRFKYLLFHYSRSKLISWTM